MKHELNNSPDITNVLRNVPALAGASDLNVERIGGCTNSNYRIAAGDDVYVLRLCGENGACLGIDRRAERQILQAVESAGIGPEVVYFCAESGHMVTRFIEGRRWSYEEYQQPETLDRVIAAVKRLHRLPAIPAEYSPFNCVRSYARQAAEMGFDPPEGFEGLLPAMDWVEKSSRGESHRFRGLCHNDLFEANLLDDGNVRIIDWEFVGMGDVFFDLATLVLAYDTRGLPGDLRDFILREYFGVLRAEDRQHLESMAFVALLCVAAWAVLHHALRETGRLEARENYDYLGNAKGWIRLLREQVRALA